MRTPRALAFCFCMLVSLAAPSYSSAETQAVMPMAGFRLAALSAGNVLVTFDAGSPQTISRIDIKGVSGALLGIDRRPADGKLYAVSDANDLYTIDPVSGAAKLVSTLTVPYDGAARGGFDFNPQSDRLRLVSSGGQNLRAHADLGATAVDGSLVYARADPHRGARPSVTAVAYTAAIVKTPSTKTFDIDFELDMLVLQEPPNDGTLTTVGPLGVDFAPTGGFDIATDESGRDYGFAASGMTLYAVDLASGRLSGLGTIGGGSGEVIGLAVLGLPDQGPTSDPAAQP